MDYLPSKNFILGVLVAVVLAAGILWSIGSRAKQLLFGLDPAANSPKVELNDGQLGSIATTSRLLLQNIADRLSVATTSLSDFNSLTWPKDYTVRDLKLGVDNPEQAKLYGQTLAKVLSPFSVDREGATKILIRVAETGQWQELSKLKTYQTINQQAVTGLLTTTVPPQAASAHLKLVSALNRQSFLLGHMQQLATEPKLALESGAEYIKNTQLLYTALAELDHYFSAQKIVLNPEDKIRFIVYEL